MGYVVDTLYRYWLYQEAVLRVVSFLKQGFYLHHYIIPQVAFDFCERQRKNQIFRIRLKIKLLSKVEV
jgi:hypothetical protein